MKFLFALLALYLIATTFAANSKSQAASERATREAISSFQRLSTTKLGKTLLDTIQIELKVNTKADPRPRILQLLKEILDDTNEQINGLNVAIGDKRVECQQHEQEDNDAIANLQQQISQDNDNLAAVSANLAASQEQYNADVDLAANLQAQLNDLQATRQAQNAIFQRENGRLQKIKSILEQTRAFIAERLDQRLNPSFLQKNNILVEIKKKVMSSEFQAASAGWGKFINFLATKALEQIKQTPDEFAIDRLGHIVAIINDIIETVTLNSNVLNNNENDQLTQFNAQLEDLTNQLTNVNGQITGLQLQIEVAQTSVVNLNNALERENAELAETQEDLADEQNGCQLAEDQYSESLGRSNDEVEVINEVIEIINDKLTNLRSAVETAINTAEYNEYAN